MKKLNILVTGCEGDIAISIAKIIKSEGIAHTLVGCDIHQGKLSSFYYDRSYTGARADSENYRESLFSIVEQEHIDIVVPASEPELRVLLKNNFFDRKDLFLTANEKAMRIGFDKYETARLLKDNNLPYPWTVIAFAKNPCEVPCILKSRTGCGSRDIHVVTDSNIEYLKEQYASDAFIYQELLPDDCGEYTCGVWRGSDLNVRTVILKRKLYGGFTGSGTVIRNENIEIFLVKIAALLDLHGSINVQLRLKNGAPFVFEINPRFSSTVMFRHKMGFKDFVWSLEDKCNEAVEPYTAPEQGTSFYKVFEELVFPAKGNSIVKYNGGGYRCRVDFSCCPFPVRKAA